MKCPRTSTITDDNHGNRYVLRVDCIKEDCAVWDKVSGYCFEVTKTKALVNIADSLRLMAKSKRL